ncbi:MAG: DoxX family protein [Bdellovibrionales bacterium]|nr:DoxX family protein [Bdellovibrionales bacterium]
MKTDLGLLVLRLGFGGTMLFSHGIPKLLSFSEKMDQFPDPIGLGSPVSLALAIFAEALCSAAVALGLWTRFACIPLIVTMSVAAFQIHAADPFQKKELALMYLIAFVGLALTNGGKYALDRIQIRAR